MSSYNYHVGWLVSGSINIPKAPELPNGWADNVALNFRRAVMEEVEAVDKVAFKFASFINTIEIDNTDEYHSSMRDEIYRYML